MGIGAQAIGLLTLLTKNNILNGKTVCELGDQALNKAHQHLVVDFPNGPIPALLYRQLTSQEQQELLEMDTLKFYRRIGYTDYESIDANGKNGAHSFDLNYLINIKYGYNKQFDLVTNFGTTEHVFNQATAFENIHHLTKKGGIMIGVVPAQGAINHGYFNYHPQFFKELAAHNKYEVLDVSYTIINKRIYTKFPFPVCDEFYRMAYKHYLSSPQETEEQVSYAFRKIFEDDFVFPYQTSQTTDNVLGIKVGLDVKQVRLDYPIKEITEKSVKQFLDSYTFGFGLRIRIKVHRLMQNENKLVGCGLVLLAMFHFIPKAFGFRSKSE